MAIALTVNGVVYEYPEVDDTEWGPDATDWAAAVTTGMLQKAGGLFQLLAEVDFGTSYGVKALYFKSRTANPSSAGQVRLAKTDVINWRNNANDADLSLGISASDVLQFDGANLQGEITTSDTTTISLRLMANVLEASVNPLSLTNAEISGSAAIAYSKLSLAGSIINADVSNAAAIAYAKLNLTDSIINADINASAAIAYTKLALTGSIVNADVSSSAAIAFSKLATLSSGNILVGNVSNVAASVAVTGDMTISNAGVTAIGANKVLNSMLAQMAQSTFKGRASGSGTGDPVDLTATQATAILNAVVGDSGSGGTKGLVPAPAAGDSAAGKFLKADGTWAAPSGSGDVVGPASSASGQIARFSGTTGKLLTATPATISNSDVDAAAAIAYSKLDLSGSIVNADINASAAIALSKLAALTASRALVSDGSGFVSAATTTATEIGYVNGVTSAIQTQLGTKVTNPMTTGGDIIYGGASGTPTRLANGSAAQYLASAGGTSAPAWTSFLPPTIQRFTSTGSTTGYRFTVSSANATVGATYTNNGNTYTVLATIAGATTLFCSQASAPQASGTLTKASGTGDATITFSAAVPIATYTLSAGAKYIRVKTAGAGGGGAGSGTAAGTASGSGGSSTFGFSLLTAAGGNGGSFGTSGNPGVGGTGGSATVNSPAVSIVAVSGGAGVIGQNNASESTAILAGGHGGENPFGGAGASGAGVANTGAGGGGAGGNNTSAWYSGGGGGAGGYIEALISSPSATYVYAVGTSGAAGGAGTGGAAGGAGGSGIIIVEEYYQ